MVDCLIALGANLGDRKAALDAALAMIAEDPQSRVIGCSQYFETAAVGGPAGQQAFLNAAARLETSRDCAATWQMLANIEQRLGRVRDIRWGPRTIDLDLLLYGSRVERTAELEVPHPRMAFRRFVLAPAAEVAGDMVHPTIGWTIERLLAHLDARPNYVALVGPIGAGKSRLAAELAVKYQWHVLSEPIVDARLATYYADPKAAAWQTERAILRERQQLLAHAASPSSRGQDAWTVSDFWFDQSLAFARRWMDEAAYREFAEVHQTAVAEIARPKFIAWIDAPTDLLLQRIAERGRIYERHLDSAALDALRAELLVQLQQPSQGPVLRIEATEIRAVAAEVVAAAEAME